MAFSYGFFNAKNLDRTYTAENFCDYLGSIICNGIQDNYGGCFKLTASKLKLTIASGKAWIDGHYFISDTAYSFDLSKYVDESLPRYISIGICCNTAESYRKIEFELSAGTPATNPTIPRFTNTDTKTYLTLCVVRIEAGATELSVTDYRGNYSYCGYVRCILGKCKVTEMLSEMADMTAKIEEANETINNLRNEVAELETKVEDVVGDVISFGKCGDDVEYIIYSTGKIILRGSGSTYDYEIGKSPFFENVELTQLILSDGITRIGNSLFERCSNMTMARLCDTLEEIGERSFFMYSVGGINELIIPSSVTAIGQKAFACQQITEIVLPSGLTNLSTYIFMESTKLKKARVECSLLPGYCFVRCSNLSELTLSKNVTRMCDHALNYCSKLNSITYEGTLEEWSAVKKDSNWDGHNMQTIETPLTKIICLDGYMEYDSETKTWNEVKA